jgi:hypothetical protein
VLCYHQRSLKRLNAATMASKQRDKTIQM